MPSATSSPRLLAAGLALLLVLAWGSNYSFQKALLAQLQPQGVLFARYLITPACALALLAWRYGWRWPRVPLKDWPVLLGLAGLGHVVHVTVMTHAMHLSTPFSSALISALGPVFTLLLVRMTGREPLGAKQIGGVALALAGILVFMSDKLAVSWTQSRGDALLLAGALFFSLNTVCAKGFIARHGATVFLGYTTLLATVPLLLMNLGALAQPGWATLSAPLWIALLWSLAGASFGGWLAWAWLNHVLGVARTAPLLYLLPPVAGVIAWAWLGESFGALKIAGALMALAGVAAAQFAGGAGAAVQRQPEA